MYVAYTDRGVNAVDLAPSDEAFARGLYRKYRRAAVRDQHPPQPLRQDLRRFVTSMDGLGGEVDLSMVGPFERIVLERLRRMPKGQVRTYRDTARATGHPGAARAGGPSC